MRLRVVFKIKIPQDTYNDPLCADLEFAWADTRVNTKHGKLSPPGDNHAINVNYLHDVFNLKEIPDEL